MYKKAESVDIFLKGMCVKTAKLNLNGMEDRKEAQGTNTSPNSSAVQGWCLVAELWRHKDYVPAVAGGKMWLLLMHVGFLPVGISYPQKTGIGEGKIFIGRSSVHQAR